MCEGCDCYAWEGCTGYADCGIICGCAGCYGCAWCCAWSTGSATSGCTGMGYGICMFGSGFTTLGNGRPGCTPCWCSIFIV